MEKLALVGEAGAGKDFVVDVLVRDYDFTRVSFSDQLKKIAIKIYPWMEKDYHPDEKEIPLNITLSTGELITKTPREIWLELNSLRKVEDMIFVRMLEAEISLLNVPNIVISDIRTKNELEWAKENEFTIIYLHNENSTHEKNSFDDFARSLSDKTDFYLENDMNGEQFIHDFMRSCIITQDY